MEPKVAAPNEPHLDVDASTSMKSEVVIDNATLERLLAEVRNEDTFEPNAYNRMHNRHNR